MIYLIDDTPIQMLRGYFDPNTYEDCFRRIDSLPLEDVPSLAGASCVLMHSSYNNAFVRRRVLDVLDYGDVVPVVLFSDGDNEEAEYNGDNYIISIKKSILYGRLPAFLKEFRERGLVNLNILSTSKETKPASTEQTLNNNIFGEFFSTVNIDFSNKPEKEEAQTGIYCIGREGMNAIAGRMSGEFIKFHSASYQGCNQEQLDIKIHDFLHSTVKQEARVFILDTDAAPDLMMLIAMHIRLTSSLPGMSSCASIVFVSDLQLEKFIKKSSKAQIFMTDGTYLCHRSEVEKRMDSFLTLDSATYRTGFLDKVNVPAPKGSNHSLANQWGASRLYFIIKGGNAEADAFKEFQDIHKRLYFKYIFHKIPSGNNVPSTEKTSYKVRGATGKHILLIDDEANKGWAKTLSLLLSSSHFDVNHDVICEKIGKYEDLSEEARRKIEEGGYDLILLDLRLGGVQEDFIVEAEQMSGYNVLQEIKRLNKGTQVIMLTASNKAWNFKKIMNRASGADGYFVKESPEYEFTEELSKANLNSLIADMERCLSNSYLKEFWSFICKFEAFKKDISVEVCAQLKIAYEMVAKAETADDFRYAYLSLYQCIEIVTSKLTDWHIDPSNKDEKLLYLNGGIYAKELEPPTGSDVAWHYKPFALHHVYKNGIFPQKDKLAALYLQIWNQEDAGLLYLMEQLIAIRSSLIHVDNTKLFDASSPIREGLLINNPYFRDTRFVYSSHEFRLLFKEAANKGLLYSDANGRPTLHNGITASQLGIRFLLTCFKEILPFIEL